MLSHIAPVAEWTYDGQARINVADEFTKCIKTHTVTGSRNWWILCLNPFKAKAEIRLLMEHLIEMDTVTLT